MPFWLGRRPRRLRSPTIRYCYVFNIYYVINYVSLSAAKLRSLIEFALKQILILNATLRFLGKILKIFEEST